MGQLERQRRPATYDDLLKVPDHLVAEILDGELYATPISPSTAALDRGKKLAIYAREAVPHVWLVDAIAQTLEILRLEAGRWTIVSTWAGADVVRAQPFEALDLDLRTRKEIRVSSWASRRPPGKARGVRIPGVCK